MVKRWQRYDVVMALDPEGDYVLAEDYDTLAAENVRLQADKAALAKELSREQRSHDTVVLAMSTKNARLQQEVTELRSELAGEGEGVMPWTNTAGTEPCPECGCPWGPGVPWPVVVV